MEDTPMNLIFKPYIYISLPNPLAKGGMDYRVIRDSKYHPNWGHMTTGSYELNLFE